MSSKDEKTQQKTLFSRVLAFASKRMVVVLEIFPKIREMYRFPLDNNDKITSLPSISWGRGITSKHEQTLLAVANNTTLTIIPLIPLTSKEKPPKMLPPCSHYENNCPILRV